MNSTWKADMSEIDRALKMMGAEINSDATTMGKDEAKSKARGKVLEEGEILETSKTFEEKVKTTKDGILYDAESGKNILVYIVDHAWHAITSNPSSLRRLHFAQCSTLRRMSIEKRYDRYIMTIKFGPQWLIHVRKMRTEVKLLVCKNCLNETNYDGYKSRSWSDKREIVSNFSVKKCLDKYKGSVPNEPTHSDKTVPDDYSYYTPDWQDVSRRIKEEDGYKCTKCGDDRRHNKHAHHKNGVKSDNRRSNLRTLCISCHAKEHPHMQK